MFARYFNQKRLLCDEWRLLREGCNAFLSRSLAISRTPDLARPEGAVVWYLLILQFSVSIKIEHPRFGKCPPAQGLKKGQPIAALLSNRWKGAYPFAQLLSLDVRLCR